MTDSLEEKECTQPYWKMIGGYLLNHSPNRGASPKDVEVEGRNFVKLVGQEFFLAFKDWAKGFVVDTCDRSACKIQDLIVTPIRSKLTGGALEKDKPDQPC